jgi:ATPase subunit of ABC transporter with duplicated ATPase domains
MQNKDLATTAVLLDETQVIKKLLPKIKFPAPEQQAIVAQADAFISIIRQNKNFSIEEFILDADPILHISKKRMNILEQKEELNDNETEEYNKLAEYIYQKEWDKYEAEAKRIINGLGFINMELPVSILSGGKRMILAIGKALLRKPDILIFVDSFWFGALFETD